MRALALPCIRNLLTGSRVVAMLLAGLLLAATQMGCRPQQPVYFFEDGDLSHYVDVATSIDYPDVNAPPSAEVDKSCRPFSLDNQEPHEMWDLKLEEAVQIALANAKIMKTLGGQVQLPPEYVLRNPQLAPTIYDPAIVDSDPRGGTEAALSAFDAQFATGVFWEKNDIPRNTIVVPGFQSAFPTFLSQDVGNFQTQIQKTAATGGTFTLQHTVAYDKENSSRLFGSDWNVNLQAEVRQPLLQGAGVQFNRIAGPNGQLGAFNGVMLARIRTDISLAEFEQGARDLVSDVETAYWELYYSYRALDTLVAGRDSGLQTWRQVYEKFKVGSAPVHEEAQARQQYFLFRSSMERALTTLYQTEANLRYLMGIAATDGRLIRPADEPTHAKVSFDWCDINAEAIARQPEIRQEKWNVKSRELELIGAKNFLLPRLDAVARYAWVGLGDDLIRSQPSTSIYDNAYENMLTSKNFQWHVGLEFSVPLGQRREHAGVRNAQLELARERARLQEMELELSHELANAIRQLDSSLVLTQTNFNRRVAARDEVRAAIAKYEAQVRDGTLTNVLDAQRRLAEAEGDYYRALVDYNEAIMRVHYRKGSLLEYNGVCLAEGPWPAKAYFDATRRARARDAAMYLDYGFTMPKVISRGPINQKAEEGLFPAEGEPTPAMPESVPAPKPMTNSTAVPAALPSSKSLWNEDLPLEPAAPMPMGQTTLNTARRAKSGSLFASADESWTASSPSNASAGKAKAKYDLGSLDLTSLTVGSGAQGAAGKSSRRAAQPIASETSGNDGVASAIAGSGAGWTASRAAGNAVAAGSASSPSSRGAREGVLPVSHEEPADAPAAGSTRVRWVSPSDASAANDDESFPRPSTAATDQPAASWKRVQR